MLSADDDFRQDHRHHRVTLQRSRQLQRQEPRGLEIAGLVVNQLSDELDTASITNKGMLEQLTGVPILAEIIHGQDFLEVEPFSQG